MNVRPPTPCERTGKDDEKEKEKEEKRRRDNEKYTKRREKQRDTEKDKEREREKKGERERKRASLHLCSSLNMEVHASSSQFFISPSIVFLFFFVKRKRVSSCSLRYMARGVVRKTVIIRVSQAF